MADKVTSNEADELNELLQSALDDFDKPLPAAAKETAPTKSSEPESQPEKDLQKDFEAKFANLLLNEGEDSAFSDNMSNLLNEVRSRVQSDSTPESVDGNADTVNQAINSLMENMEQIRNSMGSDQIPDNFNVGGIPMMEQMFQMLMSKEVLYPSLLNVRERYPKWLEENRDKVSADELNRYTRQYKIIDHICMIFESEQETDSERVKQERFTQLVGLLQEMSDSGQPPKDLAESLPSMGNEMLGGADLDPNNCSIM